MTLTSHCFADSSCNLATCWLSAIFVSICYNIFCFHFINSLHVSFRFPQLTEQLLLDSLPTVCKGIIKTELVRRISAKCSVALTRCSSLSESYSHNLEMTWQPETVTLPTALASDGNRVIACGDNNGSITLLDISSAKVFIFRPLQIISYIEL